MIPYYENKFNSLHATDHDSLCFPLHLHNLIECIYVKSGTIQIHINQETRSLNEGEMAIIFPNVVHSYHSGPEGSNFCEFLFYPIKTSSRLYGLIHGKKPQEPFLCADDVHPDISKYFHETVSLFHSESPDFLLAESLIELILIRSLDSLKLIEIDSSKYHNIIEKALTYLANNLKNDISLEGTAKYLGVSKYYLSHTLNDYLGINFSTYINQLRIDYAKNLLLFTRLPVSEIAFECGYNSLRTFNRSFKQITNLSPTEFRQTTL